MQPEPPFKRFLNAIGMKVAKVTPLAIMAYAPAVHAQPILTIGSNIGDAVQQDPADWIAWGVVGLGIVSAAIYAATSDRSKDDKRPKGPDGPAHRPPHPRRPSTGPHTPVGKHDFWTELNVDEARRTGYVINQREPERSPETVGHAPNHARMTSPLPSQIMRPATKTTTARPA